MTILADHQIAFLARSQGMITPFVDGQKREGVISYGVSSYGYDARLAEEFKIFTNINSTIVDPKAFSIDNFVKRKAKSILIPPNSFVLAHTFEKFKIPRNITVICLGKSTYARCGLIVNVTPLEAGWEGTVTIELSNTTPSPIKVYANEGICQFLFFRGEAQPDISYADRAGKYMNQVGVTLPRI